MSAASATGRIVFVSMPLVSTFLYSFKSTYTAALHASYSGVKVWNSFYVYSWWFEQSNVPHLSKVETLQWSGE
jgi:hypothetical protein